MYMQYTTPISATKMATNLEIFSIAGGIGLPLKKMSLWVLPMLCITRLLSMMNNKPMIARMAGTKTSTYLFLSLVIAILLS